MKPILKYPQINKTYADELRHHIPVFRGRYIDPFVGEGSIFFRLNPKRATICDADVELIRFYREARDTGFSFIYELYDLFDEYNSRFKEGGEENMTALENIYAKIREDFNKGEEKHYRYPTQYLFLNKISFTGQIKRDNNGEVVKYELKKTLAKGYPFNAGHLYLLDNTAILEGSYTQALDKAKEGDFIFLNPPSNDENFNHEELAQRFKSLGNINALLLLDESEFAIKTYRGSISERILDKKHKLIIRNY